MSIVLLEASWQWTSTPAGRGPAPAIVGGSIGKQKIGTCKRSSLRLLHPSAVLQAAKIDGCEAEAFDEVCHRGLRSFVIAGNEQHPPSACSRSGPFRQIGGEHRVECLHQRCAWSQFRDNFARDAPPEIVQNVQMLRIEKWIGCVNQNAAVPWRQAGQSITDRFPRYGQQYDLRLGRFDTRDARRTWPQFGNDLRQFGRPAVIAEEVFVTLREGVLRDPSSNVSRSEHSNLHAAALQSMSCDVGDSTRPAQNRPI